MTMKKWTTLTAAQKVLRTALLLLAFLALIVVLLLARLGLAVVTEGGW